MLSYAGYWRSTNETDAPLFPCPGAAQCRGVPQGGAWRELINTDAAVYGGSGIGNHSLHADAQWAHGHGQSLVLHLPPLSCLVLEPGLMPA